MPVRYQKSPKFGVNMGQQNCGIIDRKQDMSSISGYFCPEASTLPKPCPKGSYGPIDLMSDISQCSSCDEGYYCPQTGLNSSFAKCHAGYYCVNGSITAQPINQAYGDECPAGTFCIEGSGKPTDCEAGEIE